MNRGNGGGNVFGTILLIIILVGGFFYVKSTEGGLPAILDKVSGGLSSALGGDGNGSKDGKSTGSNSYDPLTFVSVEGKAEAISSPELDQEKGDIKYYGLDDMGRSKGFKAFISRDMYLKEKNEKREPITKNPPGWKGNNKEVTILYKDKAYHGWFYNRSHLLADSLGGSPDMENMVTGTRMQNVGWNDNAGGMGYMENKIRKFLAKKENQDCSVYYSAKPDYKGDELVPRTVTLNARSCDREIDEKVVVYNVAPGYIIDYSSGSFRKDPDYDPNPQESAEPEKSEANP